MIYEPGIRRRVVLAGSVLAWVLMLLPREAAAARQYATCADAASRRARSAARGTAMADSIYAALDSAYGALRRRDYDAAIGCFEAARRFAPRRADILKNLAYTYLRIGDNDRARARFTSAIALDSTDERAALELAFLNYEEVDAPTKARAHRLFSRLRSSRDPEVRAQAERAYENVERVLVERIARIRGALQAAPSDYSLTRDLSRALEEGNRLAEAEATYRSLLSLDPSQPAAYIDLARVLRLRGRITDALAALRTAAASTDPFVSEPARDELARLARTRP